MEEENRTEQQTLTPEEQNQLAKRQQWTLYNHRRALRQKLKLDASNFINQLMISRGNLIDRETMTKITVRVQALTKLPYRWTDADLSRARHLLSDLEQQYLRTRYTKMPKDETELLDNLRMLTEQSPLHIYKKSQIILQLLRETVEDLYLKSADDIKPSPEAALLFLTQDLKFDMPKWFHEQLIELLKQKYRGKDFTQFMIKTRHTLMIEMDKTKNHTIPSYSAPDEITIDSKSLFNQPAKPGRKKKSEKK